MLQENFWDDTARASTTRWSVINARTGAVSVYALSNEAYTEEERTDMLRSVGFNEVTTVPSLTGKAVSADSALPVVLVRR